MSDPTHKIEVEGLPATNPLGFVPYVEIRHIETGDEWGESTFEKAMALLDEVTVGQRCEAENRACTHRGLGLPRDRLQQWRKIEGPQGAVGRDFSHLTQRSR